MEATAQALSETVPGRAAAHPARRSLPLLLSALALTVVTGCASAGPPPRVAAAVEVARYLGTWYEIARLPFSIQDGCFATTATYSLREDGDLRVENRCLDGSFDGEPRVAVGKAWVVDQATNAKLEVQFFWPFSGDYWILDLDPDYQWALVGSPDREYLWILSRTPGLDEERYAAIVARAAQEGYPVAQLLLTPQRPAQADQARRALSRPGT